MKAISIALCTYNGGSFLEEQLQSYLSQELLPDELVVCDDGSTDSTPSILKAFKSTAPFRVLIEINRRRLGISGNFERAIELCEGDIIALSDQDDVWKPGKLLRVASAFERRANLGLVFSDADAIDARGKPLGYRLWDAVRFDSTERTWAKRGDLLKVLLRHYVVTGATLAFHSRLKPLILPLPSTCLHDAWIAFLAAAVSPAEPIEEPLIGYRQHSAQANGGERILSLLGQARAARQETPDTLTMSADRFYSIRERLNTALPDFNLDPTLNKRLENKIAHLCARATIREGPGFRLLPVFHELITGRYYRYSHPWKAVAADLFL